MEAATMTDSYREVLSWLRGGDMTPDPVMEDRFIEVIAYKVQEHLEWAGNGTRASEAARRQERRTSPRAKLSIRHMVDEMRVRGECGCTHEELMGIKTERDSKPATELPPEPARGKVWQELDSYSLAMALRYLGGRERHPLNMSQIQIMLYMSYGVWLARRGERLTAEHPQVWQFGPVFPRAYSRCRKDNGTGQEEYERLRQSDSEVAAMLERMFRTYAWTPAKSLTAVHVADGTPWAEARKGSPDKWGAQIADEDIRAWFAARIA